MDQKIFKAYDIRGIVPTEMDGDFAYQLGKAYATLRQQEVPEKKLTIVVGKDMRLTSDELQARLIEGLVESGVDVVNIGLVSTPTFYFAVGYYQYDGGIQVSASHNPKEYNGFKMVRDQGKPIGKGTGMEELQDIVVNKSFVEAAAKGTETSKEGVVEDAVREETVGINVDSIKPLTIVVDAANAMGALDVEAMFTGLPCKLIKLNFELDGTFPVHQPDPLDEDNLKIVQDAVKEHNADLGIAPDGDGDRFFFIDNNGEVIRQEILRGVMAQLALKDHPGATVCYDIRPGRITRDLIEAAGGKAVVTKVGHSLIKATMLEHDAVFGGESSGHYFYRFPFGTFEAPITLTLKFLEYISQQNKTVAEIVQPYRKYHHSGEVNSTVDDVQEALKRIQETYKEGEISLLDGVTVEFEDWWFNVRGSNTEPLIRLNLEARSQELMEQKRDEVLGVIRLK